MIAALAKINTSNHDRVYMALKHKVKLQPSQDATLQEIDSSAEKNTDYLLNLLTRIIKNCKYFDQDQNQSTINEKNSLVLLHLNIHSLQKTLIYCMNS